MGFIAFVVYPRFKKVIFIEKLIPKISDRAYNKTIIFGVYFIIFSNITSF